MLSEREKFGAERRTEGKYLDMVSAILKPEKQREDTKMKGYYSVSGFYGLMNGRYVLFSSENDYYEAMEED